MMQRAFTGDEDLEAVYGVDLPDDPPAGNPGDTSDAKPAPNPYRIMPPPSRTFIQLRFQLSRFGGVYRIVRLPVTFTFANMYRFVLFLFGWSGEHSHKFEVCTNAVITTSKTRRGEIKSYNMKPPPPPDPAVDPMAFQLWAFESGSPMDRPAWEVYPCGRRSLRESEVPPYPDIIRETEIKEDHEVTLADVWSMQGDLDNASKGDCLNHEVAIKLEYDLGASWEVHITIQPNEQEEYLLKDQGLSYQPEVMVAKGAPPVEDPHDYVAGEREGRKKSIRSLLFNRDSFEKYLSGEIGSQARAKELAVYYRAEEAALRLAKAQEREERGKTADGENEDDEEGSGDEEDQDHEKDDDDSGDGDEESEDGFNEEWEDEFNEEEDEMSRRIFETMVSGTPRVVTSNTPIPRMNF